MGVHVSMSIKFTDITDVILLDDNSDAKLSESQLVTLWPELKTVTLESISNSCNI